jgi:nitroreductase
MKIKKTQQPVLEVLRKRWSPRSFSGADITAEELATIFEAASCAPSAFNTQPWAYAYAQRGSAAFEKMLACMAPLNSAWAKKASILMLGVVKTTFDDAKFNNNFAEHDMGAANMAMFIQATSMDIYGHTIAGYYADEKQHVPGYPGSVGFEMKKVLENFTIPNGYKPYLFLAFGRLGKPEDLPEEYQKAEKEDRPIRPLAEFVFENDFPILNS